MLTAAGEKTQEFWRKCVTEDGETETQSKECLCEGLSLDFGQCKNSGVFYIIWNRMSTVLVYKLSTDNHQLLEEEEIELREVCRSNHSHGKLIISDWDARVTNHPGGLFMNLNLPVNASMKTYFLNFQTNVGCFQEKTRSERLKCDPFKSVCSRRVGEETLFWPEVGTKFVLLGGMCETFRLKKKHRNGRTLRTGQLTGKFLGKLSSCAASYRKNDKSVDYLDIDITDDNDPITGACSAQCKGFPLVTDWLNGLDEKETGGILQADMLCNTVARDSGEATFTQLKFIQLRGY